MRITRWDQELSTEASNEVFTSIAFWYLSSCDECSQGLSILQLLAEGRHRELCEFVLDYNCLSPHQSACLRQALAFFAKRADLDLKIDRRQVAWEKFKAAESRCSETNELFRKYARGGFQFRPSVEAVLFYAQQKIAEILGEVPSLEDLKFRFGPGSTTQVKKKNASPRRKLSARFACSEDLAGTVSDVLAEMPAWAGLRYDPEEDDDTFFNGDNPLGQRTHDAVTVPVEIHHGQLYFVPKNARTDRSIVTEPMLNTMVQLGIGDLMAERLRRFGIDIRDQTRNQRAARLGSLTGELATLDLSSASDLIASGLVESLLPVSWWLFLSRYRTGTITTPEGVMRLAKFSSMGNGYTFPLETLIFYALALGCCEGHEKTSVSVYGDDVLIPTTKVELFSEVLNSVGFILNTEKSFSAGPFRESCGKDYHTGFDIRPVYMKGPLSGQTCFILHNFFVRSEQPELASQILELIDESLRLWGPDGYGDGHLIGDYEPKPYGRSRGWAGFTFETYTMKSPKYWGRLRGDFVYPSYSIYVKELTKPPIPVRVPGINRVLKRRFNQAAGYKQTYGSDVASAQYSADGLPGDVLPGTKGYKRVKIYTLKR